MQRPDVKLTAALLSIEAGDEVALHRAATALAAGAVVCIMDSARIAARIRPDDFPGMRNTAAAVRVAIVNGDLSGLQGCGYDVRGAR